MGSGIEAEPGRQRAAVGKGCREGEGVADIDIAEAGGRNGEGEACVLGACLVGNDGGSDRTIIRIADGDGEILGGGSACGIGCGDADIEAPDIAVERGSGEGLGSGIEAEPGRQRAAVGKGCREGEAVADIDIAEAGGRNGEGEACVLGACLVGNDGGSDRTIIRIADGDGEILGGGSACGIGCGDADIEAPDIAVERGSGEGLGSGIEAEPGRQRAAVGKGCREGEAVADIDIAEAGGRNGEGEACVLVACLVGNDGGSDRTIIRIADGDGEILGGGSACGIGCGDADIEAPDIAVERGSGEGLGSGIEAEPGGQRAAVGKGCREGEPVADIDIAEASGRNGEGEACVLGACLVGNDGGSDRTIIRIADGDGEILGGGSACGIGCGDADIEAPTSPLSGVPEKVWVPALKLSQAGSGLPSARVAERVRLSPTSTSLKLAAGTVKEKPASSVLAWSAMTAEATGPSFVLLTVTVKSWAAEAPAVSVAVTRISRAPDIAVERGSGEGLGSGIEAEPGWQRAAVGEGCREGEAVADIDIAEASGRHGEGEACVLAACLVGNDGGSDRTIIRIADGDGEILGGGSACGVGCGDADIEGADIAVERRSGEGLGSGIEAEPGGQRAAVGEGCREGEAVADIDIAEASGRHGEGEACVLGACLVGNDGGSDRTIIRIADGDGEILGGGCACGVGCGDADIEGADIAVERRSGEGLGSGIEAEPGWQRAAVGEGCREGEAVADIDIAEASGRNGEGEACVLAACLVGNDGGSDRTIIRIADGDGEILGGGSACGVGCGDADIEGADIAVERRSGEGLGSGIEAEPGGQRAAVGEGCREGEAVADIDIAEAGGRNGEGEACVLAACLVGNDGGSDRTIIRIADGDGEILGGGSACGVGCGDADIEAPDIAVERGSGEGLGSGIEAEPGWQRAAVGEGCREGEAVADIDIAEASGRNGEGEACVLAACLVGNDGGSDRTIIRIADGDGEILGGGCACGVGCGDADIEGADIAVERGSGEGLGSGIEAEPGGQRAAVGEGCREGEAVADIDIAEASGRNGEGEACVLAACLVGNDGGSDRTIIRIADGDGEILGGGCACGVGCGDADIEAPTSPLSGVPEKVWVPALKLSQAGSGLPSARVAERVRLSPTSTSLKLAAGTVKEKPASSLLAWSAMTAEATGPSFVLLTVTVKSWEAVAPAVSVAVTRISRRRHRR